MLTPRSAACRRGQWSLIGTLVAVAIIIVLAALYIPRIAARRADAGQPHTPMQRADDTACLSYQTQINQAITLYKMDHDDRPPRTVDDLKKYGVTDEMLHAPGCNLVVPASALPAYPGAGRPYGGYTAPGGYAAPGAPPPPPGGGQRGPGGVTIPNIPGAGAGGDLGE